MFFNKKITLPEPAQALPGRSVSMPIPSHHSVLGHSMLPPYPDNITTALVGMGCFWGAERLFWTQPGVYLTAVGYAGGYTPNANYDEVCSGQTGHAEVVKIWFDPAKIGYMDLLQLFWESHNPTQGMRQGNDVGTQYRSVIYTFDKPQQVLAEKSREGYESALNVAGFNTTITTEIVPAHEFYYAEPYHQQYLAKNPDGYCGLKGIGVRCPVPDP